MKQIKISKIAKDLNISHSAVSQWFNGKTKPCYQNMIALSEKHNIPMCAWKDIKSFLDKSLPNEKQ